VFGSVRLDDFYSLFEYQNNILIPQLSICFDSKEGRVPWLAIAKLLAVALTGLVSPPLGGYDS
jgi:hypothetical protein